MTLNLKNNTFTGKRFPNAIQLVAKTPKIYRSFLNLRYSNLFKTRFCHFLNSRWPKVCATSHFIFDELELYVCARRSMASENQTCNRNLLLVPKSGALYRYSI